MQQNSDILWLPVSGGDTYLPFKPFSPKLDAPEKSDKLLVVLRFHLFLQWPAVFCLTQRPLEFVYGASIDSIWQHNITNTTPPHKKRPNKQRFQRNPKTCWNLFLLNSLIHSKTNSHNMWENPKLWPTNWELNSTVPDYRACACPVPLEVRCNLAQSTGPWNLAHP